MTPVSNRRCSSTAEKRIKSLPKIPIAPGELQIVGAAVKLGDWLISRGTLNKSQRDVIRKAQGLLVEGVFPPPAAPPRINQSVKKYGDWQRSWAMRDPARTLRCPDPVRARTPRRLTSRQLKRSH